MTTEEGHNQGDGGDRLQPSQIKILKSQIL